MIHPLFSIVLGSLTLLSFSPSSLAAGSEESKENGEPPARTVKTEDNQEPQKISPLLSLDRHLFQQVGGFLPTHDLLQLAQVSKYCLSTVASHFSMELSLEHKNLTEEDFLRYFNPENGIYKEAQCLSLSGSSFHPEWLRLLPQTLKSLKLKAVNMDSFRRYGFKNESSAKIAMLRALGETLPGLKYLDISKNHLRDEGAQLIAAHLRALTSLNIQSNYISVEGARLIAENLTALISLNISNNVIKVEGAQLIAEHLTTLTSLNIQSNYISVEGARFIAENLKALTSLDISHNEIKFEGARLIAENLKALTYLDISGNSIGDNGARLIAKNLKSLISLVIYLNWILVDEVIPELREQLPSCEIMF